MPTLTFLSDPAGQVDFAADAHVLSGGNNVFNSNQSTGWVGRDAKSAAEVNIFARYDVVGVSPGVPLGSIIVGVNLRYKTSHVAVGVGSFSVGLLLQDTVWEDRGYQDLTAPDYTLAYNFSGPQTDAPQHPTNNNSTVIIADRILLNRFSTSLAILWTAAAFPADRLFTIGQGIGFEDFSAPFVTTDFNAVFNLLALKDFSFVLDSNNVGNGANRLRLWLTPLGGHPGNEDRIPALVVKYTENPPVFTSTPITDATAGVLYSYDADADPYSLGDQTGGNSLRLTFSLTTFPTGMTVDPGTGVVSWTPTFAQGGASHPVVLRVQNEGGIFSVLDQSFSVAVPKVPGSIRAGSSLSLEMRGRSTLLEEVSVAGQVLPEVVARSEFSSEVAAKSEIVAESAARSELRAGMTGESEVAPEVSARTEVVEEVSVAGQVLPEVVARSEDASEVAGASEVVPEVVARSQIPAAERSET